MTLPIQATAFKSVLLVSNSYYSALPVIQEMVEGASKLEVSYFTNLTTDQARQVVSTDARKPIGGLRFVIVDCQQAHPNAIQVLLKVVEEPTHTHFIFVSSSLDEVPETIISRCAIQFVEGLSDEQLISFAKRKGYLLQAFQNQIPSAYGSYERLLYLMRQDAAFSKVVNILDLMARVNPAPLYTMVSDLNAAEIVAAAKRLGVNDMNVLHPNVDPFTLFMWLYIYRSGN